MKKRHKRYKGKRHYFNTGGEFDFLYSGLDLLAPGAGMLAKGVSNVTGAIADSNANEYGFQGDIKTGKMGAKDMAMSALGGFDIGSNINNTIDAFNSGDPLRGAVNIISPHLGSIWTNKVNMDKKREELDKAALDERNAEHFNRQITDMRLDRNKYGTGSNIFAAMGAEIPVPGGQLAPVGGAYVAQGNSHEQGGMQLANAEIEGGELVRPQPDGTAQIDSAQLGTAQANAPLLVLKEDIMKRLEGYQIQLEELNTHSKQSKNRYTSGDVERGAEIIQNKMKELEQQLNVVEQQIQSNFAQQQAMNGENGENTSQQQFRLGGEKSIGQLALGEERWNFIKNAADEFEETTADEYKETTADSSILLNPFGAKVGKLAKDVNLSNYTPYLDNIGNAVLNRKLRKMDVPKPNYRNPLYMETDYNIDGQLAMINQNTADFNQSINNTIGNSAVANAFRLANMKNQTENTVKLVSDKLHTEMNARNQLAQSNQTIDSTNKALKDAYDMEVFKKKIRTDYTNPSQNLANIEDNIKDARTEKNLKEHQNLQRQIMKEGYDKEVAGAVDKAYINGMNERAAKNYVASNIRSEPHFRAAIQQVEEGTPAYGHLLAWAKNNQVNGEYTIDGKKVTFKNGEIQ